MAWINVDYYFYTDMFKGTVIPESTFDRKIIESEAFINKITFGRIHKYALRPDDLKAVKFAMGNKICGERPDMKVALTVFGKIRESQDIQVDEITKLGNMSIKKYGGSDA